ncbi:Hypothetical protein D9617_1g085940 [Elsinoe fawcettii]|nr:Hypothetical protein D9617_1g085940 [Elsinoe fawcettii]
MSDSFNATMPLVVASPIAMKAALHWLDTLTIGLLIGSIISLVHRFYIRAHILRTVKGSDWMLLLTVLFFITCSSLYLFTSSTIKAYLFLNSPTFTTTQTTTLLRAATVAYSLAACTIKLCLCGALPKSLHTSIKPIINSFLVLQIIATSVFIGMTLFPCGATLAVNLTATCNASTLSSVADTVWSIANASIGLLLLLVGISDLCKAEDTARAKAATSVVLLIGAAAVASAAVRAAMILDPVSQDPTLQALTKALAGELEIGLAITAACMAVVRPTIARWLDPTPDTFAKSEQGEMLESRPVTRGVDRARDARRDGRMREFKLGRSTEAWVEQTRDVSRGRGRVGQRECVDERTPEGSPEREVMSLWKS